MAAFTYVRGLGLWVADSEVPPSEWEEIESRWPKIANFGEGGTWEPSATINLTGAFGFGNAPVTGNMEWSASNYPKLTSRSLTYYQPMVAAGMSRFVYSSTSGYFQQTDVTDAGYLDAPLTWIPSYGTITEVGCTIDPDGDGGSAHPAVPSTVPRISLYSEGSELFGANDGSASNVAYETEHNITASSSVAYGLGEVFHPGNMRIRLTGETGSNDAINMLVKLLWVKVTVTQIRP